MADSKRLPFKDESFDLTINNNLYAVRFPEEYRVLRRGARIVYAFMEFSPFTGPEERLRKLQALGFEDVKTQKGNLAGILIFAHNWYVVGRKPD